MRTTVAIPLHRSAPWLDTIEGNIRRLHGHARILVSDPGPDDGALCELRTRLADLDGIDWVGPRDIPRGWVAHCNDLVARASTELVMWLPHDDDVDADWVVSAEAALDARPDAVLALGAVRSSQGDVVIPVAAGFDSASAGERLRVALEECRAGDVQLLGAAFRGVFRRERSVALAHVIEGDQWSDVLWAAHMLTRGSFVATPAVYIKRWHAANTHGRWSNPRAHSELHRALESYVAELPASERRRAVPALWGLRMRVGAALRRLAYRVRR